MASSAPWTAEEIRQNAQSWTLEGDGKLLEFMQSISENLENRATATTDNMNRLTLDMDRTNVALGNIINQLSALQDSQFVENRVYEDDETIANVTEVPVEDQNDKKKYDPIETLNTVLKNSITMMERCYEKVSIEIEDSDEEGEPTKSVVYRPKNPYDNRPLPYIIGSKEWTEKWHIGLCDSDDDYSGEENEDEFSESSENASISASLPSNAPTISESEFSVWGLRGNPDAAGKRAQGAYQSSDEDVSSNTRQSSDENKQQQRPGMNAMFPQHQILPNDDPAASRYYVHQPKQKERGLFDDSMDESTDEEVYNLKPDRKKPTTREVGGAQKISNIFSDEPPEFDVVDKVEKERPVDLFYESDGEAGTTVKKNEPAAKNILKKTVNLFDDDDFDSFMKELNDKTSKAGANKKEARNLFNESSEDEEVAPALSIVQQPKEVAPTTKPIPKASARKPKIIKEIPTQNAEITIPTASVSKPNLKESLFDDDSPDELFTADVQATRNEIIPSPKTRKVSLFDDEPPVDDSSDNFLPVPAITKKLQYTNLFDDEPPDDDFDTLFNTTKDSRIEPKEISRVEQDSTSERRRNDADEVATVAPKLFNRRLFDEQDDAENGVPKLISRNIFADVEELPLPIPRSRSNLFKLDSSKLFIEVSDDADLFSVNDEKGQEVDNVRTLTVAHRRDEVGEDTNREEKISNIIHNGVDNRDEFDEVTSTLSTSDIKSDKKKTMSNIFSDDFLDEEITDELLESDTSKVAEVFKAEAEEHTEFIPEDDIVPESQSADEYSEQHPANKDLKVPSDSLQHDPQLPLPEPIPKIKDEPNEKSVLTKTDLSSILNESNKRSSVDIKSNEQITKRDIFASTLFSDIPPDDDIFENPSNDIIDDNAIFAGTNTAAVSPSSALTYSSVGLFHDIPPDDDFQTTGKDTKKLHSIFYDDFSETVVPPQLAKSIAISSYIFDEPPPDSFEPTVETMGSEKKSDSKIERTRSQSKITSLIEKVQKDFAGPSQETETVRSKPQPKRLNSNLSINVAALLPGAKRPPVKLITGEKIEPVSPPSNVEEGAGDSINKTPRSVQIESDPSKLLSLNKTRVKIQVKRRPSTRKARQENYRRSLVGDDEVKDPGRVKSEHATDTKISVSTLPDSLSKTLFSDDLEENEGDWLASALKSDRLEQKEEFISDKTPTESVDEKSKLFAYDDPVESTETIAKQLFSNNSVEKEGEKTLGLFGDDDDLVEAKLQSKPSTASAETKKRFMQKEQTSEALAEDEFFHSSEIHESPKLFDENLFANKNNRPNNAPYKSFLDNETDDEEIAQPVQSEPIVKHEPAKPSEKTTMTRSTSSSKKPPSNLFLEDDDGDDLFASAMATSVAVQKPPPTLAQVRKLSATEIQKPFPTPDLMKEKTSKSQKISLFDDHSDDEDLFDRKLKVGGQSQTKFKSKPIFGSDEDDNDDIFGSTKAKIVGKTTTDTVTTSEKLVSNSSRKSVFEDIDDDDDLFIGANIKSRNVPISAAKKIEKSSSVSVDNFNDPLADLLKKD